MFKSILALFQSKNTSTSQNEVPTHEQMKYLENLSPETVDVKSHFWDDASLFLKLGKGTWKQCLEMSIEKKIYDLLSEHINSDYYALIPHASLREFFQIKDTVNVKTVSSFHVDFLILDKKSWRPIFAIESDGSQHQKDFAQAKRDLKKGELLRHHRIPCFHIKPSNPYTDINLYNAWIGNQKAQGLFPVYHELCGSRMKYNVGSKGPYYECPCCRHGENDIYSGKPYTKHADNVVIFHI